MRRVRYKKRRIFVFIIVLVFVALACFHGAKIIKRHIDNNNLEKQLATIGNLAKTAEVADNQNTEIIDQQSDLDAKNPYFDYIKMKMLDVDFSELKTINPNVKGWINVSGTNVNYPFVQAENNEYYLTHSFDNSYNDSGWVFLDYRNREESKATILYAHARFNGTMFGSLKNILGSNWLSDKNNFVIRISTETENSLWQIFSVYHLPETNDYLRVDFLDDNDFLTFANMLKNRSVYNFETDINPNDKILTLSTCYNDTERLTVHAKLIKKEVK